MDPHGHVKELYRNLGDDGINSLVKMMNGIKAEGNMPRQFNRNDIKVVYKGKGDRCDVLNGRGIFIMPIVQNILDSLIYEDE